MEHFCCSTEKLWLCNCNLRYAPILSCVALFQHWWFETSRCKLYKFITSNFSKVLWNIWKFKRYRIAKIIIYIRGKSQQQITFEEIVKEENGKNFFRSEGAQSFQCAGQVSGVSLETSKPPKIFAFYVIPKAYESKERSCRQGKTFPKRISLTYSKSSRAKDLQESVYGIQIERVLSSICFMQLADFHAQK